MKLEGIANCFDISQHWFFSAIRRLQDLTRGCHEINVRRLLNDPALIWRFVGARQSLVARISYCYYSDFRTNHFCHYIVQWRAVKYSSMLSNVVCLCCPGLRYRPEIVDDAPGDETSRRRLHTHDCLRLGSHALHRAQRVRRGQGQAGISARVHTVTRRPVTDASMDFSDVFLAVLSFG